MKRISEFDQNSQMFLLLRQIFTSKLLLENYFNHFLFQINLCKKILESYNAVFLTTDCSWNAALSQIKYYT